MIEEEAWVLVKGGSERAREWIEGETELQRDTERERARARAQRREGCREGRKVGEREGGSEGGMGGRQGGRDGGRGGSLFPFRSLFSMRFSGIVHMLLHPTHGMSSR